MFSAVVGGGKEIIIINFKDSKITSHKKSQDKPEKLQK